MNSFKRTSNINYFKKNTAKGGSPLPHNDPPDFKILKQTRYIPYGHNLYWISSNYQTEYVVNKKHIYIKGLGGFFRNILRHYIIGLIIPFATIAYLKSYSQDSKNYYVRGVNLTEGHFKVSGTRKEITETTKNSFSERKDIIGRRGDDFYYTHSPCIHDRTIASGVEIYNKKRLINNE